MFVIQSTAVLSYRPSFTERPLSCSLQSLEVFSCSLAAEEETALSIIDPMIVTLELNGSPLRQRRPSESSGGLLDATSEEDRPPSLEVGHFHCVLYSLKSHFRSKKNHLSGSPGQVKFQSGQAYIFIQCTMGK